jgi:hypothetical protein
MTALPGNGRHNADADGPQGQGQVVGKADDAVDFDAGRRLVLEGGNHRPGVTATTLPLNAEILQLLFQQPGLHAQVLFTGGLGPLPGVIEKVDRRQRKTRIMFHEFEYGLFGHRLDRHRAGLHRLDRDLLFFLFLFSLEGPATLDTFLPAFLPLDQHSGNAVEEH